MRVETREGSFRTVKAALARRHPPDTAAEGAADRLAPILTTSLVTGLGLLPLPLGAGEPGREIEGATAIVILGRRAASTRLNLMIVPTLALRYGRFADRHLD